MAFRRLAYHRSWFMVVVGTIGLASIVGNAFLLRWSPPEDLAYLAVVGALVTVLMIARGFTGQWGSKQVFVDVPAGKLRLPDGSIHDLDALGSLTIEKKLLPRRYREHVNVHEYRLRAENLDYYVFYSVYKSETDKRFEALESAILQSKLRRILEKPIGDGSAFRSGVSPLETIRATFPERNKAITALEALANDPDSHVRAQAAQLATTLRAA